MEGEGEMLYCIFPWKIFKRDSVPQNRFWHRMVPSFDKIKITLTSNQLFTWTLQAAAAPETNINDLWAKLQSSGVFSLFGASGSSSSTGGGANAGIPGLDPGTPAPQQTIQVENWIRLDKTDEFYFFSILAFFSFWIRFRGHIKSFALCYKISTP